MAIDPITGREKRVLPTSFQSPMSYRSDAPPSAFAAQQASNANAADTQVERSNFRPMKSRSVAGASPAPTPVVPAPNNDAGPPTALKNPEYGKQVTGYRDSQAASFEKTPVYRNYVPGRGAIYSDNISDPALIGKADWQGPARGFTGSGQVQTNAPGGVAAVQNAQPRANRTGQPPANANGAVPLSDTGMQMAVANASRATPAGVPATVAAMTAPAASQVPVTTVTPSAIDRSQFWQDQAASYPPIVQPQASVTPNTPQEPGFVRPQGSAYNRDQAIRNMRMALGSNDHRTTRSSRALRRADEKAMLEAGFWRDQAASVGPGAELRLAEMENQQRGENFRASLANRTSLQNNANNNATRLDAARMRIDAAQNQSTPFTNAAGEVGYISPNRGFSAITDAGGAAVKAYQAPTPAAFGAKEHGTAASKMYSDYVKSTNTQPTPEQIKQWRADAARMNNVQMEEIRDKDGNAVGYRYNYGDGTYGDA